MTHGLREDNLLTVEQLKTDKEPHHFTVAASLFLLYLSLGSLYFTLTDESLSFLDSLYFLIVSFTTTGYVTLLYTLLTYAPLSLPSFTGMGTS